MTRPEPAFEAPWHAELFALTVAMNEAGHFAWAEWAEVFSEQLKHDGVSRELNGGDDYFNAWLTALETLLTAQGIAEAALLADLKQAWTEAYLATPHGQPVRIKASA
ncbi:MAG: nitrile hydratase accessory protein [Cognatishimia sp.]|nr:nitrile hydratase accessory protein [Cognatishimia sp.]